MQVCANMRVKGASLLWLYVISLWMSSFRVSSCDYIDILSSTICTWEYLDYPYYPFVSSMSFGSMICVSSLRVWLTYQTATKRLRVHLTVHQFAMYPGLCVVR